MNSEPDDHANDVFPFARRVVPLLIIAMFLVALTMVAITVGISHRSAYAVLVADIPAIDAAAVTAKLDADKVPYELTTDAGRTTIRIPVDRIAAERMNLAGTRTR